MANVRTMGMILMMDIIFMMMSIKVLIMMITCSGELVVNVRLCGDMMAEPPGLTRRPERSE